MNRLLAFYRGGAPDDRGRMLAEILRQDDVWLEDTHDYIQWIFPMRVASGVNPSAPLVTDEVAAAFRADGLLQRHLLASFIRMLAFFGLQRQRGAVVKGPNWPQRKIDWFTAPTHNSLRITRILTSLSTLGLPDEASALLGCLTSLYDTEPDCGVGQVAYEHWQRAVRPGPASARR